MSGLNAIELDAVIFGGGAAGLWLLDELRRADANVVLLEAFELGSGQTIASQGIIHGGLKYTLTGMFTAAAGALRDMPLFWRRCLAGENEPDLSACTIRGEFCYLWRTSSFSSRLAMMGARAGLHVRPEPLEAEARPAVFEGVPGTVSRLEEQVIEPSSLLEVLGARNRRRVLKVDCESGLEFEAREGQLRIKLLSPHTGEPINVAPRGVVFLAGRGNARLREMADLPGDTMQRRPLHMVMARGEQHRLPCLNGHCVDGITPRITITSTTDCSMRRVWQVGGRLAEVGVAMGRDELIEHARGEIAAAIPGVDLTGAAWSTYKVDRAEAASGGTRPDDASVIREGNVLTGWPTKLALVPRLVNRVVQELQHVLAPRGIRDARVESDRVDELLRHWPRPPVALPPWEIETQWITDD